MVKCSVFIHLWYAYMHVCFSADIRRKSHGMLILLFKHFRNSIKISKLYFIVLCLIKFMMMRYFIIELLYIVFLSARCSVDGKWFLRIFYVPKPLLCLFLERDVLTFSRYSNALILINICLRLKNFTNYIYLIRLN